MKRLAVITIFLLLTVYSNAGISVTPSSGNTQLCLGDTITFTINNSPQNTTSWGWQNLNNLLNPINIETSNSFDIIIDDAYGQMLAFYCFDNNGNILDSIIENYYVYTPYLDVVINDNVCKGNPIDITLMNSNNGSVNYIISFPNGNGTSGGLSGIGASVTHTFLETDYGDATIVSFTVQDSVCTVYFDSTLHFLPSPDFYFSGLQDRYCPGDTATIIVYGNADYYNWDTTGMQVVDYSFLDEEITFIVQGDDSIVVAGQLNNCFNWYPLILNTGNCSDESSVFNNLTFYSGFTPNGDGVNDIWEIGGIEEFKGNTVSVIIFGRFGNIIWKTDNYDNNQNAFKGIGLNGEHIPDGTYFYIAQSETSSKKGFLEITR